MSDVTSYLQAQTRKAERTVRTAAIAMGVLLVVVFAYFQWLKAELRDVLAPASIAELVVNQTRAALPEIGDALESNVRTEAPAVVRFALHQALDHVLPLLGQVFQASLEEHGRVVHDVSGTHASAAFDTVLAQSAAERGKKPLSATALASQVGARYAAALDDAGGAAISERLDEAGGTLKHIDKKLSVMAVGRSDSRHDELGRRLITTWWTFLDRGRGKEAPRLADATPKAR